MSKPTFVVQDTSDVRALQSEVKRTVDQLGEMTVGKRLPSVAIGTTETKVAHSMRAIPADWFAGSLSADARVWQTRSPDERFLYLQASAAVTATIWVI